MTDDVVSVADFALEVGQGKDLAGPGVVCGDPVYPDLIPRRGVAGFVSGGGAEPVDRSREPGSRRFRWNRPSARGRRKLILAPSAASRGAM